MRRVIGRGEAELANKSFKSRSEEGRGDRSKAGCSRKAEERIVGMGGHQAEVAMDGGEGQRGECGMLGRTRTRTRT